MGYRLVAASGAAVDALISSDVGKYLEFKAIETVYFATSSLPSSAAKSSGSGSGIKIEKVPSTKAGIFSTSLLSPLEKRSLMKFLQVRACTCACACACECAYWCLHNFCGLGLIAPPLHLSPNATATAATSSPPPTPLHTPLYCTAPHLTRSLPWIAASTLPGRIFTL